jgi:hypothetical protein
MSIAAADGGRTAAGAPANPLKFRQFLPLASMSIDVGPGICRSFEHNERVLKPVRRPCSKFDVSAAVEREYERGIGFDSRRGSDELHG